MSGTPLFHDPPLNCSPKESEFPHFSEDLSIEDFISISKKDPWHEFFLTVVGTHVPGHDLLFCELRLNGQSILVVEP